MKRFLHFETRLKLSRRFWSRDCWYNFSRQCKLPIANWALFPALIFEWYTRSVQDRRVSFRVRWAVILSRFYHRNSGLKWKKKKRKSWYNSRGIRVALWWRATLALLKRSSMSRLSWSHLSSAATRLLTRRGTCVLSPHFGNVIKKHKTGKKKGIKNNVKGFFFFFFLKDEIQEKTDRYVSPLNTLGYIYLAIVPRSFSSGDSVNWMKDYTAFILTLCILFYTLFIAPFTYSCHFSDSLSSGVLVMSLTRGEETKNRLQSSEFRSYAMQLLTDRIETKSEKATLNIQTDVFPRGQ